MANLLGLAEQSKPLPWHEAEMRRLIGQMQRGQLPHALLVSGAQYSGKRDFALALARRLLCNEARGVTNCGRCHACKLSASGAHGDFLWVMPDEKSRVIKVDQIRYAVQFSTRTASFGKSKIIVLHPADTMNLNACNALLKALEEPAVGTYWILVCDTVFGMPATIRSRCQMQRLAIPDTVLSVGWLEKVTGDKARSRELLSVADGRPLLAQQYFEAGSVDEVALRRQGLRAVLAGEISVLEASALWAEEESASFLQALAAELQRMALSMPLERLRARQGKVVFELMDEVCRLRRAVDTGANPGKQLLVEATLSKINRQLGDGHLGGNMQRPCAQGDVSYGRFKTK
ncbi:MAG: hypothetical protein HRT77_10480 [Halioglobus sp.]|nr:hypothetical protein [Halioglobus sp.]